MRIIAIINLVVFYLSATAQSNSGSVNASSGWMQNQSINVNYVVGGLVTGRICTPSICVQQSTLATPVNDSTRSTDSTNTTSIEEHEFNFTFYPNPATTHVNISRDDNETLNYTIYNSIGQIVLSGIIQNNQIDVNALKNGIYFINLKSKTSHFTKRLIIRK